MGRILGTLEVLSSSSVTCMTMIYKYYTVYIVANGAHNKTRLRAPAKYSYKYMAVATKQSSLENRNLSKDVLVILKARDLEPIIGIQC